MAANIRHILSASVVALARQRWPRKEAYYTGIAQAAGISVNSAKRVVLAEQSVGIDHVDKIADGFGVKAWQLLVPGFDPVARPALHKAAPTAAHSRWALEAARMVDELPNDEARRRAVAVLMQAIEFGNAV